MEETTFTNNAAEKAEGATYGEAAFALTERSATVEKIAVWVPVTDEQLEDVAGAMAYLDARLPFMIRQRLDGQILVGNGTTPNLRGVNNATDLQTQAKGTDPVPDAIYKSMTKVRVTGRAIPGAVIIHPNDWQDIRLLRTADGIYIWGSPSDAAPERIWGVTVVQSDAQTENTSVVGDFANYSLLGIRRGLDVQVSNSHDTFFINGKQAVRADIRAVVVWLRGAAFCTTTGI
jgi:HK97 family phage major capsid protein